ncbi:hypothetical protein, partial [Streptomyces sp. URMC 124]
MFADQQAWDDSFAKLKDLLKKTADYQGKLNNAASIKECFELEDEISYHAERLYVYAHMHHDEDTANPTYQA